jgi:hypothetical protein
MWGDGRSAGRHSEAGGSPDSGTTRYCVVPVRLMASFAALITSGGIP